ncbi:MAG TPA: RNA methyltransferase [Methylophilaceae bacterium]|mgnify:FL=1|jgi:TrmH family RNA methyltransferase|nr:RNA methyltransferase [Methylophilaceae bacterium]
MNRQIISSRGNQHFKHLKKLNESPRYRHEVQQTILDGIHLIESYAERFGAPDSVALIEGSNIDKIAPYLNEDTQLLEFPASLFSEIAPVISPTGILASINIPRIEIPKKQNCILLLEDIQDPGNLGSILRSASASGVDLVYLSDHCADLWSPKVLRGGQGAHFHLPCIEKAIFSDITKTFTGKIFATTLNGKSIFKENLKGPVAFIFGNEGSGLQSETLDLTSHIIHIPMQKGIESLNVSAAVSVCLYEKYRQEHFSV